MESFIKVTKKKSVIATLPKTRKIMQSLGLNKMGSVRVHKDNNCIRGMINKVKHLVSYELIQK